MALLAAALPQGLIGRCTTYRIFLSDLPGFLELPLTFWGSIRAKVVEARTHTVLVALVRSCSHLLSKRVTVFYSSGCHIQYQEAPGVPFGILPPPEARLRSQPTAAGSMRNCMLLSLGSASSSLTLNPEVQGQLGGKLYLKQLPGTLIRGGELLKAHCSIGVRWLCSTPQHSAGTRRASATSLTLSAPSPFLP